MKPQDIDRIANSVVGGLAGSREAGLLGCKGLSDITAFTWDTGDPCEVYECGGLGPFSCGQKYPFACVQSFTCPDLFGCGVTKTTVPFSCGDRNAVSPYGCYNPINGF